LGSYKKYFIEGKLRIIEKLYQTGVYSIAQRRGFINGEIKEDYHFDWD